MLACPLAGGLLGLDEFRLLDDAVLVTIARGEVVDQDALVTALKYRLVRGAALGVVAEGPLPQDSVLCDLSNAVVTPQMAGSTPHKDRRWLEIIRENDEAVADGDLAGLCNQVG